MSAPMQFWCWTEGEPSTFRCRERGHDVRETAPIGVLPRSAWTDSQQDLIHVESQLRDAEREGFKVLTERDSLRELNASLVAEVNRLGNDLASARAERDEERDKRDDLIERYQRVCNDYIELQNKNTELLAKLDRQRVDADLARRDRDLERDAQVKLRQRLIAAEVREEELRGLVTAVGVVLNEWQTRRERELDGDLADFYDEVLDALNGGAA